MKKILSSVEELIGHTPLLDLTHLHAQMNLHARVLVKLESFNPGGSVKDRVARKMIDDAERSGRLHPGSVIIEPTSGNTGIGLCMIAAVRGYRCIIVMPDTMSIERRRLMAAYGAEIVLTPGSRGMSGAIEKASELAQNTPGSFIPGQFVNPSNPAAHLETTGPEIWEDTEGHVDILIGGVGTGGTITGVGRYLRQCNPHIQIIAVEPADSPVLSGGKPGPHALQGIGAGFVPEVLDTGIYDQICQVSTQDAYQAARNLARSEGILCGVSSGAALSVALNLAADPSHAGKTIVTILPDTGDRYLSTALFQE